MSGGPVGTAAFELTNRQARSFVLCWQGLLGPRRFRGPQGALDFVRQAGCAQYDPVDVCGKNAELVLFSRVASFKKETLDKLLYKKRDLADHWDKNMAVIPAGDLPYMARARRAFRGWNYGEESSRAVHEAADAVRALVRQKGVLCSADITMEALCRKVDWPWAPAKLGRAVLEYLYFSGELGVHHRSGAVRHYAPAEALFDSGLISLPDPHPDDGDYFAWHTLRRVSAAGLLWNKPSDAFLSIPGYSANAREKAFEKLVADGRLLPCRVEGFAQPLYTPAAARPVLEQVLAGGRMAPRLEFIAPLDSLLWDRKLVKALFGFEYKWEIYTPVEKRRYGAYVLPVLYGAGFVGRTELRVDRAAGVLQCAEFWPEADKKLPRGFEGRMWEQLERFARFSGCGRLQISDGFAQALPMEPGEYAV